MASILDLDDLALYRIFVLAHTPPFKNLNTWASALSIARTHDRLFWIVYQSLYRQVFVECKEPCTNLQSLLSTFRSYSNRSFASTSSEHFRKACQAFSWGTNADLFVEYGYVQYANELNIVIDAPMYSTAHIARAMQLLAMDRHEQWSSVRVLRIEFRYPDEASNTFDKQAHTPELLAKLARYFVSCLPSITHLQIVAENSDPIDCTFATALVDAYASKCIQIKLNFEIPLRVQRVSSIIADIEMFCSRTHGLPLYEINSEYLVGLKLSSIPYNVGWENFPYFEGKDKTVFSSLINVALSFDAMPDGAKLYMRRLVAPEPITPLIKPDTKRTSEPQLLPARIPSAATRTLFCTTDVTTEQFRRYHKYMDNATRILNYRDIDMPELEHIKIEDSPSLCQMLLSRISCPKLISFAYGGACGGLKAFDFAAMPCLQSVLLNVTSAETDEMPDLYAVLNHVYGERSTAIKTSLSLKNMNQPLNPSLVLWPGLKHFRLEDPFDFDNLVTLLRRAPTLKELVLPKLTITRVYDQAYLLSNKRALVMALLLLSHHPLRNLVIQYYAAGSRSPSFDFVMKFVVHILRQLRDIRINPELSRYFKQLAFVGLYPRFQSLRINGTTRDEYMATITQ